MQIMPSQLNEFHVFDNYELIPDNWKIDHPGLNARVFNPSICKIDDGYALVYRVVFDSSDVRRLATCRLTADMKLIDGSVIPFSNMITFAKFSDLDERALYWHADPRYFVLGERKFIYWNDGANRPKNHQFLVEVNESGTHPVGPAREIVFHGFRQSIEKNWTFFTSSDKIWCIYGINPHVLLGVDLNRDDEILCTPSSVLHWRSDYSDIFGQMRGSAQPIEFGSTFLSIAHSNYKTTDGRRYSACAYEFEGQFPFRVLRASRSPIPLPNPFGSEFSLPRLNAEVCEVKYPCGAVAHDRRILISYGINDEKCAIASLPISSIESSLTAVRHDISVSTFSSLNNKSTSLKRVEASLDSSSLNSVPVFWWDASGKSFDGSAGKRLFKVGNFGDIASRDLIKELTGQNVKTAAQKDQKLLCIGSILHTARNGDVIWGCGVKGTKRNIAADVRELKVFAVRGPLTLEVLRHAGIGLDRVDHLFDPGCLFSQIFRERIESFDTSSNDPLGKIRVVPHYRDDLILRRQHPEMIPSMVSVDDSPWGLLSKLLGAEKVISSSLHGIIFAESIGIPACWLRSPGGEDTYKFYDYYYGTGRFNVKMFTTIEEAISASPMRLPKFDISSYLATFPIDSIKSLANGGLRVGDTVSFAGSKLNELTEKFTFGFEHVSSTEGLWMVGKSGALKTVLRSGAGRRVALKIVIRPFNPLVSETHQKLTIECSNGISSNVSWLKGRMEAVEIVIPILPSSDNEEITLSIESAFALIPSESGYIGGIGIPISVCIREMSVVEC